MSDRMLGNIGTASESKRVTAHGIINTIMTKRAEYFMIKEIFMDMKKKLKKIRF